MSGPSKKLHHFEMPDDLKWYNQVIRNQQPMQSASSGPSASSEPQPMLQNNHVSTNDKKPKPATKEPKAADKKRSNASASTFHKRDEVVSKTRMLEAKEKSEDKHCMPKFSITLTREEIEEDYFGMTGKKLPRKMKKRDKNVQKDLDALFPALSLEGQKPEDLRKRY